LPTLRLLSIDGAAVPFTPTGTYTVPDVTLNKGDSCNVVIDALNIPVGTVVRLTMSSEDDGVVFVNAPPLAGTLEHSAATARLKFPTGYSRISVAATW
jgi:hypothetical protein